MTAKNKKPPTDWTAPYRARGLQPPLSGDDLHEDYVGELTLGRRGVNPLDRARAEIEVRLFVAELDIADPKRQRMASDVRAWITKYDRAFVYHARVALQAARRVAAACGIPRYRQLNDCRRRGHVLLAEIERHLARYEEPADYKRLATYFRDVLAAINDLPRAWDLARDNLRLAGERLVLVHRSGTPDQLLEAQRLVDLAIADSQRLRTVSGALADVVQRAEVAL